MTLPSGAWRLLLICAALSGGRALAEVQAVPVSAQILAELPENFRAPVQQCLRLNAKEMKQWPALSPEDLRQAVLIALADQPAAADFVLTRLTAEPERTRELIVKEVDYDAFWVTHPGTVETFRRFAAETADPDFMLLCLDTARRLEVKQLRRLLAQRIAEAKGRGDSAAYRQLAAADEYWMLLERGAMLPGFWHRAPALFSIKPADQPVRLVGLGDFGTGAAAQREVAAAIRQQAQEKSFDFGVTVGDNFYPSGMTGPDDPRWRDWWENLYGPLGITFYPSLGNHEWYQPDGAAAEVLYRSPSWRLPAEYYTFTAGPVQFFAVDTTELAEAQIDWLDRAIAASTARWKVVYGHHPIFAPARTAKALESQDYMRTRLWPILQNRVDAYICGHQHAMAHMAARDGVHFFMSGGGGAPLEAVNKKSKEAVFSAETFGFFTLEADAHRLTVTLFDGENRRLDGETVEKPDSVAPLALVIKAPALPPADAGHPLLVWDVAPELRNGPPRSFRTTDDPLKTGSGPRPDTTGLVDLHASGSAEFTAAGLALILPKFRGPVTVFDLRQEDHAFVNGEPVSWYATNNWANAGKSHDAVEAGEEARVRTLLPGTALELADDRSIKDESDATPPEAVTVAAAQREGDLVAAAGAAYVRITVNDHTRPTDEEVDRFVAAVRRMPPGGWAHFHCRAGKGRTTTFLVLYDMLRNARSVPLADIVRRQSLLAGDYDLLRTSGDSDGWKAAVFADRAAFVRAFYDYARANPGGGPLLWSEWLRTRS